jgi:hypothetical protein
MGENDLEAIIKNPVSGQGQADAMSGQINR